MRTFEHAGLVRLAAYRAAKSGIPLEEAFQDGALGLMEALDRWDESRGLAFSTFAYPRIAGAIKDAARQRDRLPRTWRRRQTEMSRAKERLRAALHCEPTAHDVASELGVSVEEVWDWSARVGEPYSLDDSVSDDGQLLQDTIAGSDGREESDQIEHMLVGPLLLRWPEAVANSGSIRSDGGPHQPDPQEGAREAEATPSGPCRMRSGEHSR